jgi:cystathionine beta-lyase
VSGGPESELRGAELGRLRGLDAAKWSRDSVDVLPAWVADMDFMSPDCALDAMRRVIDRSDIGYNLRAVRELPAAFADWQDRMHGWQPEEDRLMLFNDVLHALEYTIWHLTEPGDGIVLFTPIYPPFIKVVESAGRRIVDCPLVDGRFDPAVLAEVIDDRTTAVLWCNPHNPTGRVFDDTELDGLADVVTANDLLVISDEVWADLVHLGAAHRPVAMVPGLAERSVTVSSASKSFNLAGLRCAVAHIGSDRVMEEFDRHPARLRGHVNTLAAEATLACWREGGPWLDALRTHLIEQFAHLDSRLRNELPGVIWQPPEATYLAWLDGRGLGLDDEFSSVVLDEGRVALSHGVEFGSTGAGFARMNVATSRPILDEVLDRMVAVLG